MISEFFHFVGHIPVPLVNLAVAHTELSGKSLHLLPVPQLRLFELSKQILLVGAGLYSSFAVPLLYG